MGLNYFILLVSQRRILKTGLFKILHSSVFSRTLNTYIIAKLKLKLKTLSEHKSSDYDKFNNKMKSGLTLT
jgi:hypothetical protein